MTAADKTLGQLVFEATDQSGASWKEKWRDHATFEAAALDVVAAALRTLVNKGYTHTGGVEWRPPLGGVVRYITPDRVDGSEFSQIAKGLGQLQSVAEGMRFIGMTGGSSDFLKDSDVRRWWPMIGDDIPLPDDAPAQAATAINHQGVVVDRGYPWQRMDSCPHGAKVQLLGGGGVAYYGAWNGKDTWPKRWAPLPKLVDGPL